MKEQYNNFIKQDGINLVDFNATWCTPCKIMDPLLDEIAEETKINLLKVDIDSNQKFVEELNISGVPTLQLYKNGDMIKQWVGAQPKYKIVEVINALAHI